jgi:hypothetical protein
LLLGGTSGSHGGEYEDVCLWDVAPCSLVEIDRISEVLTVNIVALMMDAVCTCETAINF